MKTPVEHKASDDAEKAPSTADPFAVVLDRVKRDVAALSQSQAELTAKVETLQEAANAPLPALSDDDAEAIKYVKAQRDAGAFDARTDELLAERAFLASLLQYDITLKAQGHSLESVLNKVAQNAFGVSIV